ncbi:hypothetical protein MA20_07655 [Bradyrhizobium japonicum]|uniref:Uncharacterized protein n=1 Tax=Bradyrhizobium japonicum TaxID=375 RepID=A0A0A3Y193_BRAJP|nr:hypothetical protein [Bradyrhizobium japonicum]KGT80457.1 hypothetical protein MA20_07655 [Bradyrhizobium japonicum]
MKSGLPSLKESSDAGSRCGSGIPPGLQRRCSPNVYAINHDLIVIRLASDGLSELNDLAIFLGYLDCRGR